MKRVLAAVFSSALMALFMTGCAGLRLTQNDVTAFYNWTSAPPGPGTPYRFERLPSQQAMGARQDQIEDVTRTALAKVGLVLVPAAPRYSVQVRVSTLVIERGPYDDFGFDGYGGFGGFGGYSDFGFGRPGLLLGGGNRGATFGMSFPLGFSAPPYYRRELMLMVRDLTTSQVVYETRSVSDDVQAETLAVLSAMADAALRGFPQPPAGTRRINTQIAR